MAALKDYDRVTEMPEDDFAGDFDEGGAQVIIRGNNAMVDFAPGAGSLTTEVSEHGANLIDTLDGHTVTGLVTRAIEQVQADLNSRADWQRRINQAEELLGLKDIPLAELPFSGASAVSYPLIAEACVQFQARAIEEVFPSDGPCKTKIVGDRTREKEEQADRVQHHMNYQMTDQDSSYFWHVDQMLFWLPLVGSAFKKTYFDPIQDMTVSRLVQVGDFIVPYHATDLRTAPRYTHRMYMTDGELMRLIAAGYYRSIRLEQINALEGAETDNARAMEDEADDRQPSSHEDDRIYCVYEMHCDLLLPMDQKRLFGVDDCDTDPRARPLPYVLTIESDTEQGLSLRRNWREADTTLFEKRNWFTHYKYLPGLGFYGFGLLHLIGSLSESATGTLRALLDSAAFANMQGGFVSEDAQIAGGDYRVSPGTWKKVKMSADEMQRSFYTPPYREPSPALAQLFGVLVDTGRRFASITEEVVGDAPNTGPVGTTLALIEQAGKVFSGVHRRLHVAQAEEFKLRAELNFENLEDEYPYQVSGQQMMVLKQDYDGRVDVIPVSDPNIFSNVQRIAQSQALVDLAERFPMSVDLDAVLERFLKAIKVPNPEEILVGRRSKIRRDPVAENMLFMTGRPSKAFVEQDHDAHIAVHMNLLAGLNQDAMAIVAGPIQAHLAEHYAFKYYNEVNAQLGNQLPPPTWMDAGGDEAELPPEADAIIAQAAAQIPPIQIMPPDEEGPGAEQAAFEAEEQRKQAAFEADEQRKQLAFEAEQARKDQLVDFDADRKVALAFTDEERKEERHRLELARAERLAKLKEPSKGKGAK
jgi:hypothetical protein